MLARERMMHVQRMPRLVPVTPHSAPHSDVLLLPLPAVRCPLSAVCRRLQTYGTIRLRLSFSSADYASDESFSDEEMDEAAPMPSPKTRTASNECDTTHRDR